MFRAFVGRAQPRDRGQPVVHGIVFELPVGYDLHRFPIERRGCGRARELAETAQHVERETFGRVMIDFTDYTGLLEPLGIGGRSEERRVGNAWICSCVSRWCMYN